MELEQIKAELNNLGTDQNRKVYARHGVKSEQFGVSFTNLKTLAKKIQKNNSLAEELWNTGNHDLRILASMVADPAAINKKTIEE